MQAHAAEPSPSGGRADVEWIAPASETIHVVDETAIHMTYNGFMRGPFHGGS